MRKLPIVIGRASRSADGKSLTVQYWLNGEAKSRSFATSGQLVAQRPASTSTVTFASYHPVSASTSQIVLAVESVQRDYDCEYTDPDGVYWSGACATQQEIDDGLATLIALQEDVEGIQTETDAEWHSICTSRPEMCEEPYEDEDVIESSAGTGVELAVASPYVLTNMAGSQLAITNLSFNKRSEADVTYMENCGQMSPVGQQVAPFISCYSSGIAYAGSLGAFGLRIARLSALLGMAAPPAGAIGEAIGWGVITAGAVAGSAIALHECLLK